MTTEVRRFPYNNRAVLGEFWILVLNTVQQFANLSHRYVNSHLYGITQSYLPPLPQPIKAGTQFSDPGRLS